MVLKVMNEPAAKEAVKAFLAQIHLDLGERQIILDGGKVVNVSVLSVNQESNNSIKEKMTREDLLKALDKMTGDSLRGSVIKDDDPVGYAIDPNDWEVNQ